MAISCFRQTRDSSRGPIILAMELKQIMDLEDILLANEIHKLQSTSKREYCTQKQVIDLIHKCDMGIASLTYLRNATATQRIKDLHIERQALIKELDKKQRQTRNSAVYRKHKKEDIAEIESEHGIKIFRDKVGRRRCEERKGYENMIPTMEKVVESSCLADSRRRAETAVYIGDTKQMQAQLAAANMIISRSSVLRRFKPRLKTSFNARKYHAKIINATMQRVRNNGRKQGLGRRPIT
eukprot:800302_1